MKLKDENDEGMQGNGLVGKSSLLYKTEDPNLNVLNPHEHEKFGKAT